MLRLLFGFSPALPPLDLSKYLPRLAAPHSCHMQRSVVCNEAGVPVAIMERATSSCNGASEIAAEAHLRLLLEQTNAGRFLDGGPSSSYYFDLDGLKIINDRNGHLTGNHALKRLARFMKDHSRATGIATRIRDCLSLDSESPRLTVSTGVAVRPEDGRTARELLGIADRRL
jgi:GGDEF domain-containing protein